MFKSLKILAQEISSEIDRRDNEITGLQSKFDNGFQIEELRLTQRGLLTLLDYVNNASDSETVYEVLDCFGLME